MSMLAGPRRKQKVINLRAKNNAWSNDNSKFGQRMLEKMGWSAGKGLGANENGIVEHVVARYKNDEKGLGFEDKNDQWTKHEDDFNALLANLSNDDTNVEKLHSGISLEVKSKKSKARVHYHKFTRGKDLTRYSDKDLANIFGKKTLKNEEKSKNHVAEKTEDITNESEQIFTEKGSMEDYFKSKLKAFKSKSTLLFSNNVNKEKDENAEYVFQGFSINCDETIQDTNKNSGCQPFSFYGSSTGGNTNISSLELETNEQLCENGLSYKKTKKKKTQTDIDQCLSIVDNMSDVQTPIETENCDIVVSKKKKKKSKDVSVEVEVNMNNDITKSKKKKKMLDNNCPQITDDVVPPKKFKNSSEQSFEVSNEENIIKKKKNKKNQSTSATENMQDGLENTPDIYSNVSKKKKKRKINEKNH